jgi:hypothetical protein
MQVSQLLFQNQEPRDQGCAETSGSAWLSAIHFQSPALSRPGLVAGF